MNPMNHTVLSTTGPKNFSELCHDAGLTASHTGFLAVLFLAIFKSIIASTLNVYLMYQIRKVTVFHANLRWLLFHHSFNLVCFSLGNGAKAAYLLTVWFIIQDPCRYVVSLFDCKVQELAFIVPLLNGIYSLVALCLERAYATVRYRTYDWASATPWLAIFLIPGVWLSSLVAQCLPLKDIPQNVYMPMCSTLLSISPSVAKSLLSSNMSIEFLAVFLALVLYFVNDRLLDRSLINRGKRTLAARFQVFQNVTVNRLLLPTVGVHATCFTFVYIYLLLVLTGLDLDTGAKTLLVHVNFLSVLTYAIIHPTLAFTQNPHLRKLCGHWTGVLPSFMAAGIGKNAVGVVQNPANGQANCHFKAVEKIWSDVEHAMAKRRA